MGEDEGPPALRPRDGFAVIVCLLGMALALQTSQSVFVSDTWRFRGGPGNGGGSMFGRVEEERVPPPLITDMDGDGINDVVIATREPAVVVLSGSPLAVGEAGSPPHARPHQNGAHQTVGWRVIAKRSLLARVDVPSGRQPVAMAVDVSSPEGGVIVLTDGWVVLSFDKSLRLRWEVTVNPFMDKFMAADPLTRQQLVFREAVVHVLAHGLAVGGSQNSTDSSVVLVGGSVHAPPRDKLDGSAAREPHFREPSVFHGLSIDEEDALRHYSVYALQPDTGGVVWRHEASVLDDLEGGAEGSKSSLHDDESSRDRRSLGDYKLVRRHKEGHTSGGRGCARHRLDVMRALPHAWSHREDTKLTPLTLHRRPKRHTTQSGTVNSQQAVRCLCVVELGDVLDELTVHSNVTQSGGSFMHPVDGVLAQSHNSRDVKDDGSPPNVILLHGQHGIEVVHLKSGKEVCRLPLTGADMYVHTGGVVLSRTAYNAAERSIGWLESPQNIWQVPRCKWRRQRGPCACERCTRRLGKSEGASATPCPRLSSKSVFSWCSWRFAPAVQRLAVPARTAGQATHKGHDWSLFCAQVCGECGSCSWFGRCLVRPPC